MRNSIRVLFSSGCLVSLIWIFTPAKSARADAGVSNTIHHLYSSPRALGMGDAFVAVANDYNALYYNPAGLAKLDRAELNLALDAAVSDAFFSFANDIQKASNSSTDAPTQRSAMAAAIQKVYGKTFGLNFSAPSAVWVKPNYGLGLQTGQLSTELAVHNGVGPVLNSTIYLDTSLTMGYGAHVHGWESGRLDWGISGKLVNRGYFSKGLTVIELAADPNLVKTTDLQEGYTIDGDAGLLWSPYIPGEGFFSIFQYAKPTFGLVVRNVAETGFNQSFKLFNKTKTDAPDKLYRVVDVGTRWEYPSLWLFGGRGVLDIRDIGHPYFTFRKALHVGFEFDWSVASWWRGNYRFGLSEGYYTAGISAMFTIFNLDLVTYSEDVGTYSTPQENRLYMFKTSMNF